MVHLIASSERALNLLSENVSVKEFEGNGSWESFLKIENMGDVSKAHFRASPPLKVNFLFCIYNSNDLIYVLADY